MILHQPKYLELKINHRVNKINFSTKNMMTLKILIIKQKVKKYDKMYINAKG